MLSLLQSRQCHSKIEMPKKLALTGGIPGTPNWLAIQLSE
jgi:hypothetical protein